MSDKTLHPTMPRNAWVVGIGAALAGVALATAVAVYPRASERNVANPSPMIEQPVAAQPPAAQRVAEPAAQRSVEQTAQRAQTTPVAPPAAKPAAAKPAARVAAATCNNCGMVESVQTVQHKGEGSGAGAVIGGVVGGVVGNQMGGGSGKTAMTVLGAIGGGMAGNEIEKRQKSSTVYNVRVRMDDGSLRRVTLGQAAVARGDRVAVEGQNLRRVASAG
jgi:outer membrane lipoprotein SlyB